MKVEKLTGIVEKLEAKVELCIDISTMKIYNKVEFRKVTRHCPLNSRLSYKEVLRMLDNQDLVIQANKLIMSPQRFTYEEKRFLLCLISKIEIGDDEFKNYRIMYDEYASFMGQDIEYIRILLPKVTKGIMAQILEIEDENEVLRQRSIIRKATHYKKFGFVDVRIDDELKEVLLDLKERFTQFKLENVLRMRSKHAIRLYEIIKANEFKSQKKFRLTWDDVPKELKHEYPKEHIQKLLDTSYKKFYDFEKYVLKPAQEEMKKHTDLCFEYEKVKISRYLCAIDFFIQDNVPTERNLQMTIFDIMPPLDNYNNKSIKEMAIEAEKAINNIDRGKLCRAFQESVKAEYGFDFPLGLLEGISNQKIADVLPRLGSLGIIHRDKANSVITFIQKVLKNKNKET